MAINKTLKRIVTKTGEVRYYEGKKRIKNKNGQRRWVKKNQDLTPNQFTQKELKSYNALKRYNDSWKFNGSTVPRIYIDILKKMAVPVNKAINKDLATITDENGKSMYKYFMDILKSIALKAKEQKNFLQFLVEVGLPGYRGRDVETFKDNKIKAIIDFVELLDSDSFKNYTLIVTDVDGYPHRGRIKAILALRDFEIMVGEKVQEVAENSAYLRFDYNYHLDIKNKLVLVDLTDINYHKTIKKYMEDEGDYNKGDTLMIADKYEDVVIQISFS